MYFAAVLAHELGHLFAGWLVNARFQEVMVQGIKVVRDSKGLQWSFGGWEMGGHALSYLRGVHRYRERTIAIILGGPLANLAILGISLLCLTAYEKSPYLHVWIYTNLAFLAMSFARNERNDYAHIRWTRGGDRRAKSYLASILLSAVETDPDAARTELKALGREVLWVYRAYDERIAERDFEGAKRMLQGALQLTEHLDEEEKVLHECRTAFLFAYRRLDVGQAVTILPPETRAQVYEQEATWLWAAAMVALAEERWSDAKNLSQRGLAHRRAGSKAKKWFEMAERVADRHLAGRR